jgi:hypothetical protein
VVSICKAGDTVTIDGTGDVIDYAVKMRRLPQGRQMDVMLRKGQVKKSHIEQIAERLSSFHKTAEIPSSPPDPKVMLTDFTDLKTYSSLICSRYGEAGERCIHDAIDFTTDFLHTHTSRIRDRHAMGFVVDGHGDLHSKNIFLLDKPMIFDCLEFNDHLRQVDVLDELAFFCLDLELYGEKDLAKHFLEHYLLHYPCLLTDEDALLFRYFQLYRAGVKMKINLIKTADQTHPSGSAQRWMNADGYFRLFEQYFDLLKKESAQVRL